MHWQPCVESTAKHGDSGQPHDVMQCAVVRAWLVEQKHIGAALCRAERCVVCLGSDANELLCTSSSDTG